MHTPTLRRPRALRTLPAGLIAIVICLASHHPAAAGESGGGSAAGEGNVVHYDKRTYTAQDAKEAADDIDLLGYRVTFEGVHSSYASYILQIARYRPDIAANMLNSGQFTNVDIYAGPAYHMKRLRELIAYLERLGKRLDKEAETASSLGHGENGRNTQFARIIVSGISGESADALGDMESYSEIPP